MSQAVQEVIEFAADLIPIGLEHLSDGYKNLIQGFKQNSELQQLVNTYGADSAVSNSDLLSNLRKGNKELVTEAEKVAEAAMRKLVTERFAEHSIIGEELGTTRGSSSWIWVFDPVDGTSAMIRTAMAEAFGVELPNPAPGFGLSIGVLHDEQAVAGVIAELRPAENTNEPTLVTPRIWIGGVGYSATCNGQRVSLNSPSALADARLTSTVPNVMFPTRETWSGFQAVMDSTASCTTDLNCIGFMEILGGNVDLAIERDLVLPDAAALIPILESAGALVTDHQGNAVAFNEQAQQGEYMVLTAAPGLHGQALEKMLAGVPAELNRFDQNETADHGYAKKFG